MTGFAYPPPRPTRVGNPVAMMLAIDGGGAALVGMLLNWYSGDVSLGDIVDALDAPGAKAFPKAYFGWVMFVLLAATVVAALLANTTLAVGGPLRVVSPVLGVAGAALVLVSLHQLISSGSIFEHSAIGLWLVLAGFVVAGLSGIPGPRHRRL